MEPDIDLDIFIVGGAAVGKSSLAKFIGPFPPQPPNPPNPQSCKLSLPLLYFEAASGQASRLAALQPALLPFSEYAPSSGFEKHSLLSGRLGKSSVKVTVTDIAASELLLPSFELSGCPDKKDAQNGKSVRSFSENGSGMTDNRHSRGSYNQVANNGLKASMRFIFCLQDSCMLLLFLNSFYISCRLLQTLQAHKLCSCRTPEEVAKQKCSRWHHLRL
jgi:hypothetical protein